MTATVAIYQEQITRGSMGDAQTVLALIQTTRGRADLKSTNRTAGEYMQAPHFLTVYLNGSWDLSSRHWLKVTQGGTVYLGQVVSTRNPGLMGHHLECQIECRKNPPEIAV